jgi:hypothetical protein
MKIKRQISSKATKRFKTMVFAAFALLVISYFNEDITRDINEY